MNGVPLRQRCEVCDGDGYVDIHDDWGQVIGPAPCPECSDDDPYEAVEAALDRATNRHPRGDDA